MAVARTRFCTHCGGPLAGAEAALVRCARCLSNSPLGARVIVGCCVLMEERMLWIRRALAPRRGFWAIPTGFLECGETLPQAAAREVFEETGLRLHEKDLRLHGLGSVVHMNEVYVVYRAHVQEVSLAPGDEALEVRFFGETELPWDQIAFPTVNYLVRTTYADMRRGHHGLYLAQHEKGTHVDQS